MSLWAVIYYRFLFIDNVVWLKNSPDKNLLQEERKNFIELTEKREELSKLKNEFGDSPRYASING